MTETHTVVPLVALVVDDHEGSRYLMRSWLDRAGFRVVPATTGAEALALLAETSIDVAILDVNLPDMSGFEVCEAIRSNAATEGIPIVHVSATAIEVQDRSEGLLRGADAYLTEPVEPRELLAILASLLRRAHMRQEALRTSTRLRALNTASADVHAASNEQRVFEAVVAGASRIADSPTILLTGTTIWRSEQAPRPLSPNAFGAFERLMEPARAGSAMVTTNETSLVDRPHSGVTFSDESGEPAGAILFPTESAGAGSEVLPMLAQLALTTTLSLANLQALDIEHRIAIALQESLLPEQMPIAPGLSVAYRYVAASRQADVGGDFYEAFSLDEHRTVVAIGDVVGHSLHAAIIMGKIRHALRAYAIDGYDPAEVIERVDRMIRKFHPEDFTTAICGIADLERHQFTFCNAGHLPFVKVSGGAAQLVESHGTLLGVGTSARVTDTIPLAAGDRIVMVTDGLVERRRESLEISLERFRTMAVPLADETLAEAIDRLLRTIGPGDSPDDDIAIVAFDVADLR